MALTPEQMREFILSKPAMLPPDGTDSNFSNPPNIRSQALGVIISFLLLSTLAVAIRLYTKLVFVRKLSLDDCE